MAKGISDSEIIRIMRDLYLQRLTEAVNEVEIFDKRGNMIVGDDLKVRHKETQYEYTVDDVIEDPTSGEISIVLRLPEEPRFEAPPDQEDIVLYDTGKGHVLGEDDIIRVKPVAAASPRTTPPPAVSTPDSQSIEDSPDEIVFTIDQEDFEKNYEVK